MKVNKGEAGYISARKKSLGLQAVIGFGIVAAFLLTGYLKTHSRSNLFTIIAVLICLPSAKALTEWIAVFPYGTIDRKLAEEMEKLPARKSWKSGAHCTACRQLNWLESLFQVPPLG